MNEESLTLLEKLESIKISKENIYKVLIAIGASDYLDESTPFSEYGQVISSTHTKMIEACSILEYVLFGAANMNSIKDNGLTYPKFGDYLSQISDLRITLLNNLNLKGVQCSDNDSLETLVNKVLEISNN